MVGNCREGQICRGIGALGARGDLRDCVRVVKIIKIHPLQIHWIMERTKARVLSSNGPDKFPKDGYYVYMDRDGIYNRSPRWAIKL